MWNIPWFIHRSLSASFGGWVGQLEQPTGSVQSLPPSQDVVRQEEMGQEIVLPMSSSSKWILRSNGGYRAVHHSFEAVRTDLLNLLWHWAADIRDLDEDMYQEIMAGWEQVVTFRDRNLKEILHELTVGEEHFQVIRYGYESEVPAV